jgi:hypothetical protein
MRYAMSEFPEHIEVELGLTAPAYKEAPQPTIEVTGFEGKPIRVVIENWLYHTDLSVLMSATAELRKRFSKTFQRPEWAKRFHANYNHIKR